MAERRSKTKGFEQLQRFAQRARLVQTVRELVAAVMDCTAVSVGAAVSGCLLRTATSSEIDQAGAPDALALRYAEFVEGSVDPVHAALVERHVAVRSNDLFDEVTWTRHPFCRGVEAAFGLEAYMAAELVDDKGSRGVVGVARKSGHPPFSVRDAQWLQTICLHASVALVRLALGQRIVVPLASLTAKQRELVRLVANGLTNDQIALACGVSRHAVKKGLAQLFAKTDVASRAELVARVQLPEP